MLQTSVSQWLSELILSPDHSVSMPDGCRPKIKEFMVLLDKLQLDYSATVESFHPSIYCITLRDPIGNDHFIRILRQFIQFPQVEYRVFRHQDLDRVKVALNALGIDFRQEERSVIKDPIPRMIRETDFTVQCSSLDEILKQLQDLNLEAVISPGNYVRVANTDSVAALRCFLADKNYCLDVSAALAGKFERLLIYLNEQYTVHPNRTTERVSFKHKLLSAGDRLLFQSNCSETFTQYDEVAPLIQKLVLAGLAVKITFDRENDLYMVRT